MDLAPPVPTFPPPVPAGPVPARSLPAPARLVIAGALLLPAAAAWLISYLLPSVSTVIDSFHRVNGFQGAQPWVGGRNYSGLGRADFDFALLLAVVPLLIVLLLAPFLAWMASLTGRAGRLTTIGVLAVPMAAIAPAGIAVAWFVQRVSHPPLSETHRADVAVVIWLSTFGLVCAIATSCYLAALRRRSWGAVATVAGLLVLLALAAALQVFSGPYVELGAGARIGTTPVISMLQDGFLRFQFGRAAATGSVLLAVLAFLGLVAAALVVLTRLRIEVDGWREPAAKSSSPEVRLVGGIVAGLILFVLLMISGYGTWPWLAGVLTLHTGRLPAGLSGVGVFLTTWGPPLVSTVVAIVTALLGGFAIGGLRPLGRWSELLLLPFAPWLFVGTGPLVGTLYQRTRDLDQVNTWLGLIPPGWLSVPALFVFTLLFRGQHARWRSGASFASSMLLPALPMAGLLGGLLWVLRAQDLLWPLVVGNDQDRWAAPVVALQQLRQFSANTDAVSTGLLPPLPVYVLVLLGILAVQLLYTERLALKVGREEVRREGLRPE